MNDVCEKLSDVANEKNDTGEYSERDFLREIRNDIERRASGLFVIQMVRSDGNRHFWTCSTTHGCGWNPDHPKQAFSKSELSREIFQMIDRGRFCPIIIRQLVM